MIKRIAAENLGDLLGRFPAVALIGPRQAGKTTLAKSLGGQYFDLEQPGDRVRLDLNWSDWAADDKLVILDEAQAYPEVFPLLRGAIDSDRKRCGRFLLLGSVSPSLMTQVSESLAGRLALLELTPLLAAERPRRSLSRLWLTGGYPEGGILGAGQYPLWQRNYLSLLSQRDLPNWGLPAKPQVTDRLLKMVAAVHGQLWNASQIGQGLGLSYATVNTYMDYLEGAYLVRRLPPFRANMRKRLTKSPRVYWRDTGLLHALLGADSRADLLVQPWVGASWEGFVIEQILSFLELCGHATDPCFFRTSDGYEVDLVVEIRNQRYAIEAKLTSQPSPQDLNRLDRVADMIGADQRILVSHTPKSVWGESRSSCSLGDLLDRLAQL